jgi:HD-GYP domain-containing protein (c-di-GMP phosphodiesterase class II)
MKLNDREIELCHFAGHLHDIGKIGVPDSILTKKSKLSSIEYEQIKKHSEFGYNILNKVSSLVEMAENKLEENIKVEIKD